jgi:hypothetical protein
VHPTRMRAMFLGAGFEVALFAAIEGTKYFLPVLNSLYVAGLVAVALGAASSLLVPRPAA